MYRAEKRTIFMENEQLTATEQPQVETAQVEKQVEAAPKQTPQEIKQQLVAELKSLLGQNVSEVKDRVEMLKTQFYREYHQELEAAKKAAEDAAAAAGETLEMWQPAVDETELQFRELLNQYKQKKAEAAAKAEAEMQQNLLRKQNILEQMREMAQAETADVADNVKKMRDLRAEWKNIGAVPPQNVQELSKLYQQYQEQFYDLVKINIELRDLDFKKNLEAKTLLCEAAEKLQENPNIVEASRALQQLHEEWAEIGPVARELREDLWNRFKTSGVFRRTPRQRGGEPREETGTHCTPARDRLFRFQEQPPMGGGYRENTSHPKRVAHYRFCTQKAEPNYLRGVSSPLRCVLQSQNCFL